MACQVGPARVGVEGLLSQLEHLDRIEPAPVFPVKAIRAAIGRCDDVQTRLGSICLGLADRLNARAVKREDQARAARGRASAAAGSAGTTA